MESAILLVVRRLQRPSVVAAVELLTERQYLSFEFPLVADVVEAEAADVELKQLLPQQHPDPFSLPLKELLHL